MLRRSMRGSGAACAALSHHDKGAVTCLQQLGQIGMPAGQTIKTNSGIKAAYLSLEGLLKVFQTGVDDLHQPVESDQLLTQDCIMHIKNLGSALLPRSVNKPVLDPRPDFPLPHHRDPQGESASINADTKDHATGSKPSSKTAAADLAWPGMIPNTSGSADRGSALMYSRVGCEPQAEGWVGGLLGQPCTQPLQGGHPADCQVAILEDNPATLPCCCLDQLLGLRQQPYITINKRRDQQAQARLDQQENAASQHTLMANASKDCSSRRLCSARAHLSRSKGGASTNLEPISLRTKRCTASTSLSGLSTRSTISFWTGRCMSCGDGILAPEHAIRQGLTGSLCNSSAKPTKLRKLDSRFISAQSLSPSQGRGLGGTSPALIPPVSRNLNSSIQDLMCSVGCRALVIALVKQSNSCHQKGSSSTGSGIQKSEEQPDAASQHKADE
ncbi:MAG: hypothetical protein FRX49_10076 [Trebouxia sp. A1-2]|nr:MAG: hypothetical protein FRX49_10076 [Trebouxia sp. A1-2]